MQAKQIWVYDLRWSIDYNDYDAKMAKVKTFCKEVASKYQGQCEMTIVHTEDGTEDEIGIGEDWHPNYHIQFTARLKGKRTAAAFRRIAWAALPGVRCKPCSTPGINALANYVLKEDNTTVHNTQFADHFIYKGQDLPAVWKPFQQQLIDYCIGPYTEREILWVYDPIGESGKSKFAKFMKWKHGACRLNWSTAEAMCYMFCKKPSPIVIINLAKQKPKNVDLGDLYNAIESIKDGDVDSPKYQGQDFLGMPPQVVVLANHRPDVTRMTQRRFKVKCVDRTTWTLYDSQYDAPAPAYLTARRNVLMDTD